MRGEYAKAHLFNGASFLVFWDNSSSARAASCG